MLEQQWQIRRQVPEDDPAYQAERSKWGRVQRSGLTFGRLELASYEADSQLKVRLLEDNQQAAAELTVSSPEAHQGRAKKLAEIEQRTQYLRREFNRLLDGLATCQSVADLFSSTAHQAQLERVQPEIAYMLDDPNIQAELQRYFGDDVSELSWIDFSEKVAGSEISTDLIYIAMRRHDEQVQQQEQELAQFAEKTKAEFKEAVLNAIQAGWLPPSVADHLPRIDQVAVQLVDILNDINTPVLGESHTMGKVYVNNITLRPDTLSKLRATLFHELLHELSGKSVRFMTELERPTVHEVNYAKSGLALKPEGFPVRPNLWLNEAVTEWLALKLSGYTGDLSQEAYKGSDLYQVERQELDRLFDLGLEEGTVIEAYFENFSFDQSPADRGKHYVTLVRRVRELEGPGGLLRIGNQHVLREVGSDLLSNSICPKDAIRLPTKLPEGLKLYTIHIQVGNAPTVRATQDFVYLTRPIEMAGITAEQQWEESQQVLNGLAEKFGEHKISYTVTA